uniref:CNH domain-containing protein n=1 Tax=Angiostrongylus cantonensis TaxID=6313 RepID=A0A0K0DN26_ANGCA
LQSKRLTVADLPRNIRKSSTSSRSLSIVSMSMCGSEMCIATETGGIWIASLPDLHLKAVPTVPQAIQSVIYMAPLIAISGDDESTTLISCDGFFVDSFAIAAKYLCKPEDNLLIMADGTRTVIYDVAIRNIVLDEKRLGRAVNVSPQGDVVILSEEELVTLRLEKSST